MTQISCRITPDYFADAPPLHLTVRLDGQILLDQPVTSTVELAHDISDDEAEHCLEFEMQNKTYAHSPWDNNGQSLGDCQLLIQNMAFDGIELGQVFRDHTQYQHSFNDPNKEPVTEEFHEVMGCNGQVRFKFATPAYLWLLENM